MFGTQKETANHIEREIRLLRPENLTSSNSPGKGFGIYEYQKTDLKLEY